LPARRKTEIAHPARAAAFVYGGISVAAAVAFFLVTTFVAGYPAVARYGGAAWIFLLMMIVLMPVVIPQVQKRAKKTPGGAGPTAEDPVSESGACPLE
jgi:hypothetical protein